MPEIDAARVRAKAAAATMTEAEDAVALAAALGDSDSPPLDAGQLARMRRVSAAEAADLARRAGGVAPGRPRGPAKRAGSPRALDRG